MLRILLAASAVLVAAPAARAGEPPPEEVRQLHVGKTASPAPVVAAPPVTVVLGTGAAGAPALLLDAAAVASTALPNDTWSNARWARLTPALGRYFGASEGVLVLEPPALAALTLEAGDVITAIGGHPVADPEDLLRRLRAAAPGTRIVLSLLRDHVRRELSGVAPAKPSADPPAAPGVPASPRVPRGV